MLAVVSGSMVVVVVVDSDVVVVGGGVVLVSVSTYGVVVASTKSVKSNSGGSM